jgi:16S rRNA (uracil1498-N3)-methyltransferase
MARYDFTSTRLFVAGDLAEGALVGVTTDQANYLLNVLRLPVGVGLLVFNGRHGEWRATIEEARKREARLRIVERTRPQEGGPDIDYCFAPLKHARLDYVVQKAVEMGAARLRPVVTRRTQTSRVNIERMRANVIEAAEQCGVLRVPDVEPELPFERMIAQWPADRLLVFCDEHAPVADPVCALRGAESRDNSKVAVLIGPEGGFDEKERVLALGVARVVQLSLGPRILRADTAGVAVMTLVQSVFGDWGEP